MRNFQISVFLLALFSLLVLYTNSCTIGQKKSTHIDCESKLLAGYADSLAHLILSSYPGKALLLSDSLLQKHGDLICPVILRIKSSRAYAYEHLVKYDSAIEIYNEILKIAVEHQFTEEEMNIRISLARIYESIGRPELCEQYLDEISELFKRYEQKSIQSHFFVRVASYHRIYKSKSVAIEYAKKAIELGEESGRLGSLAGGNLILGSLTDDFDESIEYFSKASHYCLDEGDYIGHLYLEGNIAGRHINRGDYERSLEEISVLQDAAENLTTNEKVYYQFNAFLLEKKALAYEGLGQKDNQIDALKQSMEFTQLFGDAANQEKINQLVLDNAIGIEQEKVKAAKRQNRILIFGILLLSGIILLILRLYFQNRRKNEKIKEQTGIIERHFNELQKLYNYQNTLFSEVHHRIKNNLQLIISLMTLQKSKLGNSTEQTFLNVLSHRINSIALIHDQLYSLKEFEKVNVSLYSQALLKNLISLTPDKDVQYEHQVDDINLNLETVTPLGLIWSELISNSLKYNRSMKGLRIHFKLIQDDEKYCMHYHDNGVGYPEGHFLGNSEGIGYTIIQSLSRQLAAATKTYNSDGAHFTMEFKEKIISPL